MNNFKATFGRYLDQISEIDKRCNKMIEGLLNEEGFLHIANENNIESVLKLDGRKAKARICGWNINCCHIDCKEINKIISETYETPFNPFSPYEGVVENEIESNELSFFINNTPNFSTINLDNFQLSSKNTFNQRKYLSKHFMLHTPGKTYFYGGNLGKWSGTAFTIDNKKYQTIAKIKSKLLYLSCFYNSFIYLHRRNSKLTERYDFKQNTWQIIEPLPQGLNYSYSCNILFGEPLFC